VRAPQQGEEDLHGGPQLSAGRGKVEAGMGARFLTTGKGSKEHGEGEDEPCGVLKILPQILSRDLESVTTLCSGTVPTSTLASDILQGCACFLGLVLGPATMI